MAVLTVPETALTYTAYGDTVFLAQQGEKGMTVKRVSVAVGERNDGRVEIVSGLQEGDRVVTSGQLKLSDGMAAEPVAQALLEACRPLLPDPPADLAGLRRRMDEVAGSVRAVFERRVGSLAGPVTEGPSLVVE